MTTAVLGPVYRHLQKVMASSVGEVRKEVDKLAKKISNKLKGKKKTQFDDDIKKAKNTRGKLRAAAKALGKVADDIDDMGEFVSSDLTDLEAWLLALIDLLRGLEGLENLEQHFGDMAKAFGG